MSLDLRELYQETIIDHNRNPRNHHCLAGSTNQANGFNPLCGDKLTVYAIIKNECIEAISFVGCGCAISQASASLMTEAVCGKSVKDAHSLFSRFHTMLTVESKDDWQNLDKLTVLAGVKSYPARVKCATLAWHTLEAALKQKAEIISTE